MPDEESDLSFKGKNVSDKKKDSGKIKAKRLGRPRKRNEKLASVGSTSVIDVSEAESDLEIRGNIPHEKDWDSGSSIFEIDQNSNRLKIDSTSVEQNKKKDQSEKQSPKRKGKNPKTPFENILVSDVDSNTKNKESNQNLGSDISDDASLFVNEEKEQSGGILVQLNSDKKLKNAVIKITKLDIPLKKDGHQKNISKKVVNSDDDSDNEVEMIINDKDLPKKRGRKLKEISKKVIDSDKEETDSKGEKIAQGKRSSEKKGRQPKKIFAKVIESDEDYDSDNVGVKKLEGKEMPKKGGRMKKKDADVEDAQESDELDSDETVDNKLKDKRSSEKRGRQPKKVSAKVIESDEDYDSDNVGVKKLVGKEMLKKRGRMQKKDSDIEYVQESDKLDSHETVDNKLKDKRSSEKGGRRPKKVSAKVIESDEDYDSDKANVGGKKLEGKEMLKRRGRMQKKEDVQESDKLDSDETVDNKLKDKRSSEKGGRWPKKVSAKVIESDEDYNSDNVGGKKLEGKEMPKKRGRIQKKYSEIDVAEDEQESDGVEHDDTVSNKYLRKRSKEVVKKDKNFEKFRNRDKKVNYTESDDSVVDEIQKEDLHVKKGRNTHKGSDTAPGDNKKNRLRNIGSEDEDEPLKKHGKKQKHSGETDSEDDDEPLQKHSKKQKHSGETDSEDDERKAVKVQKLSKKRGRKSISISETGIDSDEGEKVVKDKESPRKRGRPRKASENILDSNKEDSEDERPLLKKHSQNDKGATNGITNLRKPSGAKNIGKSKKKKKENSRYDEINYCEFDSDGEKKDITYDPHIDLESDESMSSRKNRFVKKLSRSAKILSMDKLTKYYNTDDEEEEETKKPEVDEENNSDIDKDSKNKRDWKKSTEVKKSPRGKKLLKEDEDLSNKSDDDIQEAEKKPALKKRGRKPKEKTKIMNSYEDKPKKSASKKRNRSISDDEEDSTAKKLQHVSEYNSVQLKELRIVLEHCKS